MDSDTRLGPGSGSNSKKLVAAACLLVTAQALGIKIARHGSYTSGPLISELIQLALGLICIGECLRAFHRSIGVARYAWRLLAVTFVVWSVAQGVSVYQDFSGNASNAFLDSIGDVIFFLSVIPFGLLPFLDPEGEPIHFDKLHILDFVQVCICWVSLFLRFSPQMWSAETALRIGHFTWSRNISFDGLLALTFILRALLTKSKAVRSLFGRMAIFLVLSGLADSYALSPGQDLQAGTWFDLIWSALLVIPIMIAASWKSNADEPRVESTTSHEVAINQVFPLLYPCFSFFILIQVARVYPVLAPAVFAMAFFALAARVLVIQYRQRRSEEALQLDVAERKRTEEALRQSEVQYRLLLDCNPVPMWVFDRKTLKFLSVNQSAIRKYGFSREEFLRMTIADIRPPEEIPKLLKTMATPASGHQSTTLWRHRKKGGSVIDVEIVGHTLDFQGIDAEVVAVHDVSERKRSQEMLQNSENKYRALFEDSAEATWLLDEKGFLDCNSAALKMFGYPPGTRIGHPADISPPYQADGTPSLSAAQQHMASAFLHGKARFEWLHQRKNGEVFPAEVCLTALTLSGQPRLLATVRDMTERKQAVDALLFKTALLEAQAETTLDGILVVDERNKIVFANKQLTQHFDIPEAMLKAGNDVAMRLFVADQIKDPAQFIEKVNYLYSHPNEKSRDEITLKNGKVMDRYSAPLVDSAGQYRGRIWYFRDITSRKMDEERIQYLAYYDSLTGLPNRILLRDRLARALGSARRRNENVALLFLDLDGFKHINDSLGHSIGDVLLQEIAKRLKKWGREQDTIARLGGDEFLIMLNEVKNASDAAVAAERLMDAMSTEFAIDGHPLKVGCSVGISMFPEHGTDAETLIANADAAMYRAKEYGRNNCQFFTAEMNAQAIERMTLENGLRVALDKNQLFLMYQPQIDLGTGRIMGLEALLRWQHPDLGLVPPDKFIRIAENSGLIMPIGDWVLKAACRQARTWQKDGFPAVTIAVNVSAVQLRQEGICKRIREVLDETGLAPQHLELELTESVLLANAEGMLPVVQKLRTMGVALAIDDFGTGYSSFSYLKQLRANKLKIDGSFIRDVAVNPDDAAITTAIVKMAKSLNLKVIAEGVETDAQVSFLQSLRCDQIQGYYFSKPLPAEEVGRVLQANQIQPRFCTIPARAPNDRNDACGFSCEDGDSSPTNQLSPAAAPL